MKKFLCTFLIILMLFCLISCNTSNGGTDNITDNNVDDKKYDQALELIENKEYSEAYEILKSLGDHEEAQEQLKNFRYIPIKYTIRERNTQIGTVPFKLTFNLSYNEDHLPVKFSAAVDEYSITYDYGYDSDHHLKETVGRIDSYIAYSYTLNEIYDTKGNVIKHTRVDYKGNISTSTYDYTYDADGRITQIVYDSGSYATYNYDIQGNLSQVDHTFFPVHGSTKVITDHYINTYDTNSNLIKTERSTEYGTYIYEYVYDADGKLITESQPYTFYALADVDIIYLNVNYIYNADNQAIRQIITLSNGSNCIVDIEYELVYSIYDIPQAVEKITSPNSLIEMFDLLKQSTEISR